MTKIITCSKLRHRTLDELEALFRTLQIEFGRTAPGSPECAAPAVAPIARPSALQRRVTQTRSR